MTLNRFMMSTALVALLSGPALAQATDPATVPDTGTVATDPVTPAEPLFTSVDEMTVGDMIGMIVYDPAGDRIGEIDYVVPYQGGHAGVIGIGGFLGLGEYTVAIPVGDFDLGENGASLTLDTTREALEQTPEFDESGAESLPDDTPLTQLIGEDGGMGDDVDEMSEDPATEEAGDMQTDGAATEEADGDMAPETDAGAAEEGTMEEECPEGTVLSVADGECVPGAEEGEEPAADSN